MIDFAARLNTKVQCCVFLTHLLADSDKVGDIIDAVWIAVSDEHLRHRAWVLGQLAIPRGVRRPKDTRRIETAEYYEGVIGHLSNELDYEEWPVEDDIIQEVATWITEAWQEAVRDEPA